MMTKCALHGKETGVGPTALFRSHRPWPARLIGITMAEARI